MSRIEYGKLPFVWIRKRERAAGIECVLHGAIVLVLTSLTGCESKTPVEADSTEFVPADFVVPLRFEDPLFHVRRIQTSDAERDHAAVMASAEQLRHRFQQSWPEDDFSVEQNREQLLLHEQQFARREAFVYVVLSADETVQLGCVYITPDETHQADAVVVSWVRTDILNGDLPMALNAALDSWLSREWPFHTVRFDGPLVAE